MGTKLYWIGIAFSWLVIVPLAVMGGRGAANRWVERQQAKRRQAMDAYLPNLLTSATGVNETMRLEEMSRGMTRLSGMPDDLDEKIRFLWDEKTRGIRRQIVRECWGEGAASGGRTYTNHLKRVNRALAEWDPTQSYRTPHRVR